MPLPANAQPERTPARATKGPSSGTFVLATIGFVGACAGFVFGYGSGRASIGASVDPLFGRKTYEEGYEAARQKIAASNAFPPAPSKLFGLEGNVTAVGAESFDVEMNQQTPNPLERLPGPALRTVRVTAGTNLYRLVAKTAEESQAEAEKIRQAANGDVTAIKALYSHAADATSFYGWGGYEIGWAAVERRWDWAGQQFKGGEVAYQRLTVVASGDLFYTTDIETFRMHAMAGLSGPTGWSNRVTHIFRLETDPNGSKEWRLIHRHGNRLEGQFEPAPRMKERAGGSS